MADGGKEVTVFSCGLCGWEHHHRCGTEPESIELERARIESAIFCDVASAYRDWSVKRMQVAAHVAELAWAREMLSNPIARGIEIDRRIQEREKAAEAATTCGEHDKGNE